MFTDSNSNSSNTSSSSSISGDNLITKTKRYFSHKDEAGMNEKTMLVEEIHLISFSTYLKLHHPLKYKEFQKVIKTLGNGKNLLIQWHILLEKICYLYTLSRRKANLLIHNMNCQAGNTSKKLQFQSCTSLQETQH